MKNKPVKKASNRHLVANLAVKRNCKAASAVAFRKVTLVFYLSYNSGCGHIIQLNRNLASKSRLTSNHDLARKILI